MNEQQAVLEFFNAPENLPLGLVLAEHLDSIRGQINTQFWQGLYQRMDILLQERALPWHVLTTEDRNVEDSLVGLYCAVKSDQEIYLRPMMEQQYLGNKWRIYFGLMWSTTPSPQQLALPAVTALKDALLQAGFKNNETLLGWQWTHFHPRGRDFLLRYAQHPDALLDDTQKLLQILLLDYHELICTANAALQSSPRSLTISLDQLRSKRKD